VPSVLVIGYGNSLRGDDGFGIAAAEQLRETLHSPQVRVLTCQQLTPELASEMSKVNRAIMIDAARGGTPGLITVSKIEPESDLATFTHELRPSTLLACSQELYGACPETFLVSVTGYSFDFSDKLSDTLKRIMPQVLVRVRELIDQQDS
jgi:hydrogenase maturation protease